MWVLAIYFQFDHLQIELNLWSLNGFISIESNFNLKCINRYYEKPNCHYHYLI